jgi:hypothetical protein
MPAVLPVEKGIMNENPGTGPNRLAEFRKALGKSFPRGKESNVLSPFD